MPRLSESLKNADTGIRVTILTRGGRSGSWNGGATELKSGFGWELCSALNAIFGTSVLFSTRPAGRHFGEFGQLGRPVFFAKQRVKAIA